MKRQPPDPKTLALNWNLLRTFMVIVQEGSITAAAARLDRKQPTSNFSKSPCNVGDHVGVIENLHRRLVTR
ncbi:MAG: hypothetical protein MAG794_01280 [Gammaproteobacteria bacterium]|nr:hypothetical protein [Gammaproteobacteria bacterium]